MLRFNARHTHNIYFQSQNVYYMLTIKSSIAISEVITAIPTELPGPINGTCCGLFNRHD